MKTSIKHVLRVSLVQHEGATVVDVDQPPNGHPVYTDDEPQTMVWTLVGNAVGFSFASTDPDDPGFAWKDPKPKKGIFGEPQICPSCGDLTVTNTHKKPGNNKGDFIYQLRIQKGSEVYKTLYDPAQATPSLGDDDSGLPPEDPCHPRKRVTTNPRIKNT